MYYQHPEDLYEAQLSYEEEERNSRQATPGEALREYGYNAGMDNPDRAWILTPWDTWEANPFYRGPEVPHPEDPYYEEEF